MPLDTSPNKFKTERYDVVTVEIPDPAPGAAVNWALPANQVLHIVGICFRFVTNVTVVNRWPYVYITTGGGLDMHRNPVMALQAQNIDMFYAMEVGWPFLDLTAVEDLKVGPLLDYLELKTGEELHIAAYNMVGADRFSDILIRVRQWRED